MTSKREVHDALQDHARSQPGVPPAVYLVRWVVVRELLLPDSGAKALNFASSDASGHVLSLWDAEALIRGYLRDLNERGRFSSTPPPPQPPPEDR